MMKRYELDMIDRMKDNYELRCKVDELGRKYFRDMRFEDDRILHEFSDDDDLYESGFTGFPQIDHFTYNWYTFMIDDDLDCEGCFNSDGQVLCISSEHINEETILHEMIHLHESVLSSVPSYFRDIVFMSLYWKLKEEIPDLDDIIRGHGNILNENTILGQGGEHSVLFLLKSFDIDLRRSEPLGTIFGYGREGIFDG